MSSFSPPNSEAFPTASTNEVEVCRPALAQLLPFSEHAIKLITGGLIVFESLLAAMLFVVSYWLRHPEETLFLWAEKQIGTITLSLPYAFPQKFAPYLSVLYFVPLIHVLTFWYRGLYRVRGEFSFAEDFIQIFKAV